MFRISDRLGLPCCAAAPTPRSSSGRFDAGWAAGGGIGAGVPGIFCGGFCAEPAGEAGFGFFCLIGFAFFLMPYM